MVKARDVALVAAGLGALYLLPRAEAKGHQLVFNVSRMRVAVGAPLVLSGRLLLEGEPAAGAEVSISADGFRVGATTTTKEGSFKMELILKQPGRVKLQAESQMVKSNTITVEVTAPVEGIVETVAALQPGSLSLIPSRSSIKVGEIFTLSGTLLDQLGKPMQDTILRFLVDEALQDVKVTTQPSGTFGATFSFDKEGIYTIVAQGPPDLKGIPIRSIGVQITVSPALLLLSLSADKLSADPGVAVNISGRMSLDATAVVGGTVYIFVNKSIQTQTKTDSRGVFSLPLIFEAPGRYEIIASDNPQGT